MTMGVDSGAEASQSEATGGDGETGSDDDALGPGRVTLRRLNRTEYNHTMRDLFGVELEPARDFPGEDPSFGFDNISDVLTISPLQLELYERTAESLAEMALRKPIVDPVRQHFEAEQVFQSVGAECCGGFWNIYSNGQVYATVDVPADGEYEIIARAFGHQAGDELPHMVFEAGGRLLAEFDVDATNDAPQNYRIRVDLQAGAQQLAVGFTNDFYDPENELDRNLLVDWFEVYGPFDVDGDQVNEIRERIVTCDPEVIGEADCLEQVIGNFVPRAFRRPLSKAEVTTFMGFADIARDHGGGFEEALHLVVSASLLSPHFLFRVERDLDENEIWPLNPWELASRLSYFLWSSMPDATLFARAADETLLEDEVLRAEIRRMLDDPRANSLVEDFAGQWLSIRALDDTFKDTGSYPEFDDELRSAMRSERSLFFESVLRENRPLSELLLADYSYANRRLAEFYGLSAAGDEFERIELSDSPRRGMLMQAGLLSVLAHPTSTSPVRRGKWVLEKLLCQAPPPPPGDVEIPEIPPGGGKTMKEKLARHREDPSCAGCHQLMDPIGLAFEHFDAIGRHRLDDQGMEIETEGTLSTGEGFAGAADLAELIAGDERFPACAVEQMLTYALGRGPRAGDQPYRADIEENLAQAGYGVRALVEAVAMSPIFRTRGGPDQ